MSPARDRTQAVVGKNLRTPVSLVVAHPGHELLAFGWLTKTKPSVFVVTNGSGRESAPRSDASARLLAGGLGRRGSVFGRWTDRELYEALDRGRFEPFLTLRDELVEAWCAENVQTVICDGYERRILMHDVVQITVSAAVEASRDRGVEIELLELPIYLGTQDDRPGNPAIAAAHALCDEVLERKVEAARGYESAVVHHEVEEFLRLRSTEGFRTEVLFHSLQRTPGMLEDEPQPEWESHGERLVRQGAYDHVIRLREHLVPLARALEIPFRAASGPR